MKGSIPTHNARVLLARDIHDGIAQDLVAVGYRLDCLLAQPDLDQKLRSEVRDLRLSISETLAKVRRELFELRTDELPPLHQRLNELYRQRIGERSGTCEVEEIALAFDYERILWEVAKELLDNAIAHSNGDSLSLSLVTTGADVLLRVSDNGVGISDPSPGRYGLVGVHEKIEERGGSVKILGNHGSTIEVTLPLFSL